MADYREYRAARLTHPLADFSSWNLLPGAAAEKFLAAGRLKIRFGEGRLSLWGEAGLTPDWPSAGPLDFYLFCADAWFLRATHAPVFRPDEELLLTTAGEEAANLAVLPYTLERQMEVAAARKKYRRQAFGPPPSLLLRLTGPGGETEFRLKARRLFWCYEIAPRPSGRLALRGGPTAFRLAEDDGKRAVFISEETLALTRAPTAGLSLEMLLDEARGVYVPILENLPAPGLNAVGWDAGLGAYKATVRLDLSRFGLVS